MKKMRLLALALAFGAGGLHAEQAEPRAPSGDVNGADAVDRLTRATSHQRLAALRPVLVAKRDLPHARKQLSLQLLRLSRIADDPEFLRDDAQLVVRDFADAVCIIYTLDFGGAQMLVSEYMVKGWGMDADQLHRRALANLEARYGDFHIKPVGKLPWLYVVDTEDAYAASRVLLPWHWSEVAASLGGRLVLGIPSRDVVVFTGTRDTEKLAQLKETVETVERHQRYPVSETLFEWTAWGWKPFELPLDQPRDESQQQRKDDGAGEGQ